MANKKYLDDAYLGDRQYHFVALSTQTGIMDVEHIATKVFKCTVTNKSWIVKKADNGGWSILSARYTAPCDFGLPGKIVVNEAKLFTYNVYFILLEVGLRKEILLVGVPFLKMAKYILDPFSQATSPARGEGLRYDKLDINKLKEVLNDKLDLCDLKSEDAETAAKLEIREVIYQTHGDPKSQSVGMSGKFITQSHVFKSILDALEPYNVNEFSCKFIYNNNRLSVFADRFGRFSIRVAQNGVNVSRVYLVFKCLYMLKVMYEATSAPTILSPSEFWNECNLSENQADL